MEVISFGEPNNTPPLLFIHGSYCGAWIWERHFLPHFAKAGYYGAAISLRGHGKNPDVANIDAFGVSDFLEDIGKGVKLFPRAPILIGHSLGGYLAQRYALEHDVPGLVLLGSPSLSGLAASSQHIVVNNPMLAVQLGLLMAFGPDFVDEDVIGRALFLAEIPKQDKELLSKNFQKESRRLANEALWPCMTQPQKRPPTLVLGGDKDAFVPTADFRMTADTWKGELKIMENIPHGVMIDPSWPRVAQEIREWLAKVF